MKYTKIKSLSLFFLLIAFTGCYTRHDSEDFKELPSAVLQNAVDESNNDPLFEMTEWIPENWWVIFDDEQLNQLIGITLVNNPTLQSAKTKIALALTDAAKLRSTLYPTITWNADVQREKLSQTGVLPVSGTGAISSSSPLPQAPVVPGIIPIYFTQYETALNILYDFDLWGKNRNALRAALGEVQSTIADEAFTRLSLSIAVAEVYFQLQADYEQLRIVQEINENREEYFELIKQRIQYNLDDNLIFYAALNNLIAAKQDLLITEANIAVGENQLRAYLAGDFQEEICDVHIDQKQLPKVPLPQALPLHLISHRPDIISKLWLIESACYRIKVAIAGFYPDINLMAFGGFQTIHFSKWFLGKSTYGDIQLATSLPIFTGGLLTANLRSSEVEYDLAVLDYNQLIIDAVKQILNGIVVLKNNNKQLELFRLEAQDQQEVVRLTNLRMENNIGSNLDFLNSKNEFLLLKRQEVIALKNTLRSILELIKALGGGYDVAQ